MKASHAVSLIEAAYRLELSTEQWLEGIAASATTALGENRGAMAFRYDATLGNCVHLPRERQVLGYADLGHSNKLIGYKLGLSTTTVSTILGRARKKLGSSQ